MMLSGLQSMPGTPQGRDPRRRRARSARFFSITLPWLKPSYLFITIIATINALMASTSCSS